MTFTQADLRRVQVALGLGIEENRPQSCLAVRLRSVERFDLENGTAIVADVKARLDELDTINLSISKSYVDGTANASTVSTRIDEFSESIQYGSGNVQGGGMVQGQDAARRSAIYHIKRDLGLLFPLTNTIPVM